MYINLTHLAPARVKDVDSSGAGSLLPIEKISCLFTITHKKCSIVLQCVAQMARPQNT